MPGTIAGKQQNEREVLAKMYDQMPVGVEIINGVNSAAKAVGVSPSQMNAIVRDLEKAGILSRREDWAGGGGKKAYWMLLLSREDGQSALNELHSTALSYRQNHVSLKARILEAIKEQGKFDSVVDIMNTIRQPNENLDLHNITHCLYVLRTQGKITFKVDSHGKNQKRRSNDKIPTRISYTVRESEPAPTIELPAPTPEPEPIVPVSFIYQPNSNNYPLIRQLIERKSKLENASDLAEAAGEEDLAITLLERAQAENSPFNQEVIALWNDYLNCLNS